MATEQSNFSEPGVPTEELSRPFNWYKTAAAALFIAQALIILCIIGLLSVATAHFIKTPYCWYLIGIWVALGVVLVSSSLKSKTSWRHKKYDPINLVNPTPQLVLLLNTIYFDVQKYQNMSYNNFLSVRNYKHTTIFLSGLSTVVLGVNFEGIIPHFKDVYPIYAKNVALIIGAIITAYTALTTYWNIEKYWLINKTIANKLKELLYEVEDLDKQGPVSAAALQAQVAKYQAIKSDFNKYWDGALSGKGSQGGQQ